MSRRAQLPRRRRSGLASLVGLIILAACVLGAIAAIQISQDRDHTVLGSVSWVAERLRTRDWTDVGVLVAGIACAVVGLLLLLAGLVPARRPFVRLADPDAHTLSGITRAGLNRDLGAIAAAVDGVSSARAKVGRSRVRVTVRSALRDSSGLRDAVQAAVGERVDSLQPRRPLSVATRVRSGVADVHRRTTRLNRIVFVLLGLVLLAAGGFLIGRHYDWFDRLPSSDRIYSRPEARWLHDHGWVWWVAAGVAIVVGLLVLRWLLVQPRIDRVRTLRIDADLDQPGRTAMASSVLTDAVEDDIDGYPGVARARVILIGAADAPELVVRVAAQPVADLADVHRRVVGEAIPAARTALDAEDVPAQVHLIVTGRRTAKRVVL